MKKLQNILPVLLMIWPYLFLLLALPAEYANGSAYGIFLVIYIAATIIVYVLNIWNAWTYPAEQAVKKLPLYGMLIKLVHIPFYIGVFVIGVIFLMAMVVPALLFVSPFVVILLVIIAYCLLFTSSMYGIRTAVFGARNHVFSITASILYIISHLLFVLDVIGAVCLFIKTRKKL